VRPVVQVMWGILVLFEGIGLAQAEDLRKTFPKEGSWARYQASVTKDGATESIASLTLKSLNNVTVNDAACRWFEFEYVPDEGPRELDKLLVTEKTFTTCAKPSEEVLKHLQRHGSDPLVELPPDSQGWLTIHYLSFPGLLKNASEVDLPRTVVYQRGKLTIPKAYVGRSKWSRKGQPPESAVVFESKYHVWMHPDLPAGFAHATVRLGISSRERENRVYDFEYSLQDFGDKAKAEITEESAPSR